MNASQQIQTGRLILRPVGWVDLPDLVKLKGDPRAYAIMLGGIRMPGQVGEDLVLEITAWAERGYGVWAVRALSDGRFVGMVALQERTDGRGVALRFALKPEEQGHGYASEAAAAALRYGHDRIGMRRIIAVAREDNFASRTVLGSIGMQFCDQFVRDGVTLLVFESVRTVIQNEPPETTLR